MARGDKYFDPEQELTGGEQSSAELLDELLDELGLELSGQPTNYDSLFETVPIEDDPYPPDTIELSYVDDLADFANDEIDTDADTPGKELLGDEFAFDWEAGEFHNANLGNPLRVTDDQAVVEWALKALNTQKGEYAIYSHSYGVDTDSILGQALPTQILYAQIADTYIDCLVQHPRISDAEIIDIRPGDVASNVLFVVVAFYLDNDDEPVQLEVRT